MKNWKALVGVGFSALFLYLAFRSIHLNELARAFKGADYGPVIPAMFLVSAGILMKAVRWRYVLLPIKSIGIPSLFYATGIGSMVNVAVPARLGELVRAHAIGKKEEISRSASFATIVVERVLDGFALLFLLAIVALFGAGYFQGWLERAGYVAIIGYLFALAMLMLLKTHTSFAVRVAETLFRPLPPVARTKLVTVLNSFIEGLKIFRSIRNMVAAIILSPVVWLPNVAVIHLLLASAGIHLSVLVSVLLLVALCIGVAIPSAPGFIGNVQFVCVAILKLYGVSGESAMMFSLIYTGCVFIAVMATGLVCVLAEGLSFEEIGSMIKLEK
ncbi:MAG: lysylphosphatidylglycerol synthase transmembrane domain-containing protein [Candidatus Krumholzibacteria bacterium]|nr:lysylphosphatidylglycerol synthase transmembrane domain-containing protein [Candidatus Krumholzibacteria bacterium]